MLVKTPVHSHSGPGSRDSVRLQGRLPGELEAELMSYAIAVEGLGKTRQVIRGNTFQATWL